MCEDYNDYDITGLLFDGVLAGISCKLFTVEPQHRALPALNPNWALNVPQVRFLVQTFARLVTAHPCDPSLRKS